MFTSTYKTVAIQPLGLAFMSIKGFSAACSVSGNICCKSEFEYLSDSYWLVDHCFRVNLNKMALRPFS